MTMSLCPMPKLQFFDDNGDVLAGGKVYFYAPGTLTLKATYTTSNGSTTNTNPVVLDSAGRASIFLSGFYDVAVYDASDVLVYTQYNVCGTSPSDTALVAGSLAEIETVADNIADVNTVADITDEVVAVSAMLPTAYGYYEVSGGALGTGKDYGCSVLRGGTGSFRVTFDSARGDALYPVIALATGTNIRFSRVFNRTTAEFYISTLDNSGNVADPDNFSFMVFS